LTNAGDLAADAAVVCAGAYSKPLAAALGDKAPLETERGYHLMIRDPEAMPRIETHGRLSSFFECVRSAGALRHSIGCMQRRAISSPPAP
jgi:D-amino-acid dehydrogenase